ncbi:hypothetical protein GWK48_02015 [Metallosphaera tengchongensis]|uniref:Uncharacterized protein n=1 Tax=Metallosphaera tengchongensis TaxID=1532350 RepID=A0A6N0NW30_9CREN|nr:hypothetical protein [Metallosphaera tengchongensis]QKQ99330.1 hypothetical protein GWK48_02015 [Metallosphaera tengchongensis]
MELIVEQSKSKTGKHAIRSLLFKWENGVKQASIKGTRIPPVYKEGDAVLVNLRERGTFVYARFIKNVKGRVFGKILIIKDGTISLEMNYRKLKLKKVSGDPSLYNVVKDVMDYLKIPVKRVNLK